MVLSFLFELPVIDFQVVLRQIPLVSGILLAWTVPFADCLLDLYHQTESKRLHQIFRAPYLLFSMRKSHVCQ